MKLVVVVTCFAASLLAGCGYGVEKTQPAAPTNYRPVQEKLLQAQADDSGYYDNGVMCYAADSPIAQ